MRVASVCHLLIPATPHSPQERASAIAKDRQTCIVLPPIHRVKLTLHGGRLDIHDLVGALTLAAAARVSEEPVVRINARQLSNIAIGICLNAQSCDYNSAFGVAGQ